MEKENLEKKKEEENTEEHKNDEILRLTVSKAAERALVGVVGKVNQGFSGGRVNKTQIASWILNRFAESMNDTTIKEIRAEHFDEVAVLESILRKAKESGRVPIEFKALLQKELNLDELPRKKSKKNLQNDVINDDNNVKE